MQFAKSPFLQMLLSCSNIVTSRQVCNDLLSNPSTRQDPGFWVGKAPFQIDNHAIVPTLGAQVVRVLKIKLLIRTTYASSELRISLINIRRMKRNSYLRSVLLYQWHLSADPGWIAVSFPVLDVCFVLPEQADGHRSLRVQGLQPKC